MNKRLVPRLRFRGFNNEWYHTQINKLLKIKNGQSQKNVETSSGAYPILATSGKIGTTNHYLYNGESVLIGRKGTINKPMYFEGHFWTVDTLFYSRLFNNSDGKFIFNLFKTINWLRYNTSSSIPSLTSKNIESINVDVPTLSEQQQIGTFFAKLDRMIELQSKKIIHLKQLKKGYLQKMFPQKGKNVPRLRFDGFRDEWNKKKLNELVSIKTGNKNAEDNIKSGEYAFFDRSTQIKYLNNYDYDEKVIIYPGEGAQFLPKYFDGKYSLHQRAYGLYNFNDIDAIYLYYFLNTQNNNFVRFSVGTTAKSLRKDTFKHIFVDIPSTQEQHKIGQLFKHLDKLVEHQSNKLHQLKYLKKAYLQKMFI